MQCWGVWQLTGTAGLQERELGREACGECFGYARACKFNCEQCASEKGRETRPQMLLSISSVVMAPETVEVFVWCAEDRRFGGTSSMANGVVDLATAELHFDTLSETLVVSLLEGDGIAQTG